ncbi:FAD-binding oxidoreductase [Rhodococcus sp. HNM0569]|uniref:FAD-binding oxidoreductase n=1 Tax=Rhodococcus sp. HNM0569 TaxID=2716340 RepID=UPI00146C076A|nr:FAD-binding oxidoreductase [Rhodococcus sp. HNM0569]NLU84312.1 FAD-binding oxidoreductase [Rhodococcus sp. HNM0569]
MASAPVAMAPVSDAGRPPFRAADVEALVHDLAGILGEGGVSTAPRALARASKDGSGMSPILTAQQPLGAPDLVCCPKSAHQVPDVVRAAVRRGVPITTRGKGTGNYGQAVPRYGGLVIDMTGLTTISALGDGYVTAEAGARMITLERAAWDAGQQLWMYPSTAQSTLGGFVAGGSAGTGTIVHGRNHMGFVDSLDVVYAHDDAEIVHLAGDDAQPMVHTYGVAGIIVRATVQLEPLQDWRCVYASFASHHDAFAAAVHVRGVSPQPRLCSADTVTMSAHLPTDDAIPRGRASLRTIVDSAVVDEISGIVEACGGRVEAVRSGLQDTLRASMLSYNHPTWWMQKAEPDTWFHMEVQGDALVERLDEVEAVYEDGMLHLEVGYGHMFGMLNGRYRDPQQVYDGVAQLEALGVAVHSPHQSYVDRDADRIRTLAAQTDPRGLLNPGRWLS